MMDRHRIALATAFLIASGLVTVATRAQTPTPGPVYTADGKLNFPATYRTWPGPNSNTFVAYVARAVPELRLDLPPTAIGKDYLAGAALVGPSPSGTGGQISVLGLLGVLAAWEEGLEINLLGLTFGVDVKDPALKIPIVGRVGRP